MGGRHPVVEAHQLSRGNQFIANDALLSKEHRVCLLTGPNMGGEECLTDRQIHLFEANCNYFNNGSIRIICAG